MEWQPIESELLSAAAYNAEKHTLYLRFRSGEVYR
jgi:KTSC domain-containing protein